jgi:hypothetical protein
MRCVALEQHQSVMKKRLVLRTAHYLRLKRALLCGEEIRMTHLAVTDTVTLLKIDFGCLLSAILLKVSWCDVWRNTNGLNLSKNYSNFN